jgi:hypothetical protein
MNQKRHAQSLCSEYYRHEMTWLCSNSSNQSSATTTLHVAAHLLLLPPRDNIATSMRHTHHHQITKLSHSINAIGPAPHHETHCAKLCTL